MSGEMNLKDLALNNESHPSPTTDSNQKNKFRSVVDAEPADLIDSFDPFGGKFTTRQV